MRNQQLHIGRCHCFTIFRPDLEYFRYRNLLEHHHAEPGIYAECCRSGFGIGCSYTYSHQSGAVQYNRSRPDDTDIQPVADCQCRPQCQQLRNGSLPGNRSHCFKQQYCLLDTQRNRYNHRHQWPEPGLHPVAGRCYQRTGYPYAACNSPGPMHRRSNRRYDPQPAARSSRQCRCRSQHLPGSEPDTQQRNRQRICHPGLDNFRIRNIQQHHRAQSDLLSECRRYRCRLG
ncbi:MAG: hypothetical protein FD166_186 [Bacteroidetes bacterium]|nr:MAG: hypothetical protein FD166_186 [Bacteroidota bacterium]